MTTFTDAPSNDVWARVRAIATPPPVTRTVPRGHHARCRKAILSGTRHERGPDPDRCDLCRELLAEMEQEG